jgi:integrase
VFGWAKGAKLYDHENPASRDVLKDHLPAKRKGVHHRAMPYADLPAFMERLRGKFDSVSARALEFAILTAGRTGEVIGAKWSEIDLEKRVWCIPGERMKAGKAHTVPLSDRAVEILRGLIRTNGSDYVFLNGGGRPLSNMALIELVRGMKADCVPHGFRSTFRDWCEDRTAYDRHTIETALAHVVKGKTERAYLRTDALDKRRRLMSEWAKFCASPARSVTADVLPLRA